MKSRLLLIVLTQLVFVASLKAQGPGSAGVLFLLIQPSVRANGMAGASVASPGHDAIAVNFNPGHLGTLSRHQYFTAEFYPRKTRWLPQLTSDLIYDTKSFLLGFDFRRFNQNLPIRIGAGYSRVFLDLGEQVVTSETGPEPLGTVHNWEKANVWSVGLGIDALLKVGIGWNFKRITSTLGPTSIAWPQPATAKATAHDYGVVAHLPIIEAITRLGNVSMKLGPHRRPFLVTSFGYSKSNIGDGISYIDPSQADPLPRIARDGFGISAGIVYTHPKLRWRIVSLEYASEAEQLLVRTEWRDGVQSVSYAGRDGDIDYLKHVILGHGRDNIITKRGWELGVGELVFLRLGRYDDPLGRVDYTTFGVGLALSGALKLLRFTSPGYELNPAMDRIGKHIDVQFNFSLFDDGPLDGTKFYGLKLTVF